MVNDKRKQDEPTATKVAVDAVKKERLGVFIAPWKTVANYGLSAMNKHITSFRAGQLVFKDELIEEYLKAGAPLRVYIRDVESSSSSPDLRAKG